MIHLYRRLGASGTVAAAFLLSRIVALGATHAGAWSMTEAKRAEWRWTPGASDLHVLPEPPAFLAPLIRWDAPFYLAIAKDGYPPPRPAPPVYHLGFFPLYALAVRGVAHVVGNFFWAAFLVSNASALLTALLLVRAGALVRRADGVRTALLFAFSPGAAFFSYPYSEALFTLGLGLAMYALCRRWLPIAALGGAIASASRAPGVAAALAIAAQAPARLSRWLWAVVALGGIFAFMEYCRVRYGDALAFVHIQGYHRRHLALLGPLHAFIAFDADPDCYAAALLGLAIAVRMLRRLPLWTSLTAWFLLLLPMATGTLQAMVRYQSTNLPLLCGATVLVRRRFCAVLAISCAWMAVEAFLYGKGVGLR